MKGMRDVRRDVRIIKFVIPAKAGIQRLLHERHWVPAEACPRMLESGAGTTRVGTNRVHL
jgi:hypothetical protein